MLSAYINLLKTAVCSGILAYPFLVHKLGWGGLFLSAGIASGFSFLGLCLHIFVGDGKCFSQKCMSGCVVLKSGGVATAYSLIAGNLLSGAFPTIISPRWWSLVFLGVCGPLCFLRSLTHMRFSSLLGLFCVAFLIFYTFKEFLNKERWSKPVFWNGDYLDFSKHAGTLVFSFACHQNIRTVVLECENISEVIIVGLCVILTAFLAYITFGVVGFAVFGPSIEENAIDSFEKSALVIRLVYACVLGVSFPLQIHPVRSHMLKLILMFNQKKTNNQMIDGDSVSYSSTKMNSDSVQFTKEYKNLSQKSEDAISQSNGLSTRCSHDQPRKNDTIADTHNRDILLHSDKISLKTSNNIKSEYIVISKKREACTKKDEISNILSSNPPSRESKLMDPKNEQIGNSISKNLESSNTVFEDNHDSKAVSTTISYIETKVNENISVSNLLHSTLTVAILFLIYIISISGISLGTMYSLIGSTVSATVCNILPGILMLRMKNKNGFLWKTASICSLLYGIIIIATTASIFIR